MKRQATSILSLMTKVSKSPEKINENPLERPDEELVTNTIVDQYTPEIDIMSESMLVNENEEHEAQIGDDSSEVNATTDLPSCWNINQLKHFQEKYDGLG